MVQEDFERLHKFLIETECLSEVSEDMRKLVEEEWPELVRKLPPKVSPSRGLATAHGARGHRCVRHLGLVPRSEWHFRNGNRQLTVPISSTITCNEIESATAITTDNQTH
jgi:hypothetical protein